MHMFRFYFNVAFFWISIHKHTDETQTDRHLILPFPFSLPYILLQSFLVDIYMQVPTGCLTDCRWAFPHCRDAVPRCHYHLTTHLPRHNLQIWEMILSPWGFPHVNRVLLSFDILFSNRIVNSLLAIQNRFTLLSHLSLFLSEQFKRNNNTAFTYERKSMHTHTHITYVSI